MSLEAHKWLRLRRSNERSESEYYVCALIRTCLYLNCVLSMRRIQITYHITRRRRLQPPESALQCHFDSLLHCDSHI
jgi:hypothetical protein